MIIHLVSDLHFEINMDTPAKMDGGDVLIIAGDAVPMRCLDPRINDPNARGARKRFALFLEDACQAYGDVLYIPGNHEYYGTFPRVTSHFLSFRAEHAPNMSVLDNNSRKIGDTVFIGSTLWANCGHGNPVAELDIGMGLNDFGKIKWPLVDDDRQRNFHPSDAAALHEECVRYLRKEIAKHNKAVVITHHAPSFTSAVESVMGRPDLNDAYCCRLDEMILDNPQIKLWCHGHTHRVMDYMIGETRIISNPKGYPFEMCRAIFDHKRFDIDIT